MREFPSPPLSLPTRRRFQLLARVSAVVGLLLFALNLLQFAARLVPSGAGGAWRALAWFAPQRGQGIFYSLIFALTAAAFVLLPWKARSGSGRPEQRRGPGLPAAPRPDLRPAVLEVLIDLFWPGYDDFFGRSGRGT